MSKLGGDRGRSKHSLMFFSVHYLSTEREMFLISFPFSALFSVKRIFMMSHVSQVCTKINVTKLSDNLTEFSSLNCGWTSNFFLFIYETIKIHFNNRRYFKFSRTFDFPSPIDLSRNLDNKDTCWAHCKLHWHKVGRIWVHIGKHQSCPKHIHFCTCTGLAWVAFELCYNFFCDSSFLPWAKPIQASLIAWCSTLRAGGVERPTIARALTLLGRDTNAVQTSSGNW